MQFSIFGVPFTWEKEMFTQDRLVWSICIFWASLWRTILFVVVLVLLATGLIMSMSYISTTLAIVLSGIISVASGVAGFIGTCYIFYYTLFKKNYASFDRHFLNQTPPEFFSRGFWIPYLFIIGIHLLIMALTYSIFPFLLADVAMLLLSLLTFHVYVHGKTWGFTLSLPAQDKINNR